MDATHNTILAVDETAVTSTPTWALLTGLGGVLVGVGFAVFGWMKSKWEKSDEKAAALIEANATLREQAVLNEVKQIGQRMDAAHAEMRNEMRTTLASIQQSMERHDTAIEEMRRQLTALNEWKIAFEAKVSKGGALGA